MITQRIVLAVALATALTACRHTSDAAQAAPGSASAEERTSARDHVRLDASQLRQVRIEELSSRAPADTIKTTGTVEFDADRTAKILPPVAGQVQSLSANVGDTVHRNQVLIVLSSREVTAAVAEYVASRKDLDLAEKTHAMTKDLFEHQAASRLALQQSENELGKANARVLQTQDILRVLGVDDDRPGDAMQVQPRIAIRAPLDGTVIERSVTNGQYVGPDTAPLFTIADLSHVWVQADVFERDLGAITIGQNADLVAAAYPADRFGARVSRIAPTVDAQTRTAKVRFLVANPTLRLKPGMFASISLFLSESTPSLTVPAKAIFVENGRTYAYVQTAAQEFARREVHTAKNGSERVRVLGGLSAGERFVSDGVLLLRQLESDSPQ